MSKRNFTIYPAKTTNKGKLVAEKIYRPAFMLLCMLLSIFNGFAQAPANDDPCNAVPLAVGSTCTYQVFSNENATASPGVTAPGCANYLGGDVWFEVVVPAGGALTFDSQAGFITDGGMAVYSGTCDNLVLISCNDDDGAGNMPKLTAGGLVPGSSVWVRFWEYGGNGNGTFGICVTTPPPPPANDEPCNAIPLTVGATCSYQTFTNADATGTTGVPAPGCAGYTGGDVWFEVVVPAGGALLFDTQTGVMTDGGMAIYGGTCTALTLIACDDNLSTNGLMPLISASGLTPGSTVWVRVWENGNNNNGTFGLCVTIPPPPPANDDPCNAIPVTVGATCNYTTYTNLNATSSTGIPAPGCANYLGGDVWFSAVVPAGGALLFDTQTGGITDGGMAIYSGTTCSALTLISCDDNLSANGAMPKITAGGLTPGSTVWVRFWEYGNDNNGTFGLCITTPPPPPANDDACTAIPVTVNNTCNFTTYTNADATGSTGVPAPGCASYVGGDVWFSAVVPAAGILIFDSQAGVITDGGMAIYSGTCSNLTLISCNDDGGAGNMPKITATGLTPGSTVWIRFWEYGGDANGTFGLCVTIPPANDTPCLAIPLTAANTCNYVTYTNSGATASSGIPAPGCANYQGGDVWFSVVVPAGGALSFDTQAGTLTDAGMAIYNGTSCTGPFTLIACNDNSSTNPDMPKINSRNLTPGSTVWIRVWGYGTDNTGTFGICVTIPPPPPANDDPCNATLLPLSSTCNFTTFTNQSSSGSTGVPAPSCGSYRGGDVWFQVTVPPLGSVDIDTRAGTIGDGAMAVYKGATCTSLTELACDDNSSGNPSMPFISIINQVPGSTLWIRVWGLDTIRNAGTFDICATIPLPEPTTFSFNCAKDTFLTCGSSTCFSLNTTIPNIHTSTNTYEVNPLSGAGVSGCFSPYVNPGGPGPSTSLSIDDRYSASINIPFSFPFYGTNYNTLVVSTNGYLSFDATLANAFSHFGILTNGGLLSGTTGNPLNLPSTLYDRALIMGPYHDLDPAYTTSPSQKIKYNVTGIAPNRRWILSFYKVPLFSGACDSLINNTHQIVLYEGTGVIEVFVFDRQSCPGWNKGRAMIGLQSYDRASSIMAPGRAASDTAWGGIGLNESWRFVPAGGPTLFKKVELFDTSGNFIALGDTTSINTTSLAVNFNNVCLTGTASAYQYIVKTTYAQFNNPAAFVTSTDTITVHRGSVQANFIAANATCNGAATGTITINPTSGTAPYRYTISGGTAVQNGNVFTVGAGTYLVSITDSIGCTKDTTIVVNEPAALKGTYQSTNVKCNAGNDGTITVTGIDGTAPYLYSVGGGTYQAANVFTVVAAGTPVVSIKDANGCLKDTALTITQPSALVASAIPANASCNPTPNGQITASAVGGVSPYTFSSGGLFQTSNLFTVATGNYTVSVKDSNSCVATTQVNVPFTFSLLLQGRQDTIVCDNSSVRLSTQGNAFSYSWSPSTYLDDPSIASPLASPTATTTYIVTATTGTCSLTDTVKVTIAPKPTVNAGNDISVVKGEDGILTASVTNAANFIWSPNTYLNSTGILNPVSVRPDNTITYTLTATNNVGCSASDDVLVTVLPYCIKVKNAFTPNGDGVNDTWVVYDQSECLTNINVQVFNRYGSKVYESQNYRNEWKGTYNGKTLPDATYYYVIDFTLINGRKVQMRGDVTILR